MAISTTLEHFVASANELLKRVETWAAEQAPK
jgi:hypothetical protein